MDLFTYLMAKNDHNTSVNKDLFSYLLGKGQSGTYQTFTGTSISANNTKKGKMKLSLKGNTSQTGTPTPSTPIPINVVSGDNEIKVYGKNLFNKATIVDGTLDGDGSISYSDYKTSDYIPVKPNTTYYKGQTGSARFKYYDSSKIRLSNVYNDIDNAGDSKSFTTPNNAYYIRFSIAPTINIDLLQIEAGESASEYEPYQSQTYHITLPNGMELCKIGDYQDYFTKNSDGQWCKYNAIGKVVLDGSEEWTKNTAVVVTNAYINNDLFPNRLSRGGTLCNYLTSVSSASGTGIFSGGGLNFCFESSDFDTKEKFTTWLSTHNTIVYYQLATPYLSLIEDTTLIEQLNEIEKAQSYKGTTNISQVNNDLPFEMEAEIKVSS